MQGSLRQMVLCGYQYKPLLVNISHCTLKKIQKANGKESIYSPNIYSKITSRKNLNLLMKQNYL